MCCETGRQVGNIALFWTDCQDWKSIFGGTAAWQMNPVSTVKVPFFLSLDFLSKSWRLLQWPGHIRGYHCSVELQSPGILINHDSSGSGQAQESKVRNLSPSDNVGSNGASNQQL